MPGAQVRGPRERVFVRGVEIPEGGTWDWTQAPLWIRLGHSDKHLVQPPDAVDADFLQIAGPQAVAFVRHLHNQRRWG